MKSVTGKIIRPWMLVYTIIFGLLFVSGAYDQLKSGDSFAYVAWGCVMDVVILAGNIFYSFSYSPPIIQTAWKIVFPIVVLDFLATQIVALFYGKETQHASITLLIFALALIYVISIPTFKAHYSLGYGKQDE
jgi:hypothetical protein